METPNLQLVHPPWEDKCWGRVQHFFSNDDSSVSHLEVKRGWRCSVHHHEDRYNLFLVVEGEIDVEVFLHDEIPVQSTQRVSAGGMFVVPPGIKHRFKVVESGRVVEVYWPRKVTCRHSDIIRDDVGGPIE